MRLFHGHPVVISLFHAMIPLTESLVAAFIQTNPMGQRAIGMFELYQPPPASAMTIMALDAMLFAGKFGNVVESCLAYEISVLFHLSAIIYSINIYEK